MLSYCDNRSNLSHVWIDDGISPCFFATLSSTTPAAFALIFGGIQIYVYWKYAVHVESAGRRYKPSLERLYKLQLMLLSLACIQPVVGLILRLSLIRHELYWVDILQAVCGIVIWVMAAVLIRLECHWMLPSIPTRGHGLVLLMLMSITFVFETLVLLSWFSPQWWWTVRNSSTNLELGLWCWRYVCVLGMFILCIMAPGIKRRLAGLQSLDDVRNLIINNEDHGSADAEGSEERQSTWRGIMNKVVMLWPFMWPKGNVLLQICVVLCVALLIAGRVANLYLPIYYKMIVDSLTVRNVNQSVTLTDGFYVASVKGIEFRWDYILIYIALWFLQGGGLGSMGALNNTRSFLWIYVQQYTTRSVQVRLFAHLHGLSLRWHLSRKTGEVLRVVDRGTTSVNQLLNYIVFSIMPTIVDIVVAIVYFLVKFNAWFALIVFVTMTVYLIVTIWITEWRTKFRRDMNIRDNEMNSRAVDSLLNFETVKYYGAEEFEVNRYKSAVLDYQKMEWLSNTSLSVLNTAQNIVITIGLAAGTLLCAWYVHEGYGLTVGDYVLFSTYMIQLYSPLNFFGVYYRMIQQAFIDMENMFDLMKEQQEVRDQDDADDLVVTKGSIEFSDVSFHYVPSKPILKGVSFVVPPGQTFALVGPSGSGKSTIMRLLFRFYDIQLGVIRIDDQDISQVTQNSLRSHIGVVPQDTVLFNNDIMYNVRYGRSTATDEEVQDAARVADIHDRILSFPDGYGTMVGERGLKLSGGEKQRVAIARTILKAPQFVLLDEATSALDTQTERNIQSSLAKVCENRTTLIVAHRLSTIIHADQILVLREGEIVERGTHEELLSINDGVYAAMWTQQLTKLAEEEQRSKMSDADVADSPVMPDSVNRPGHGQGHGHGHGHHH